MSSKSAKQLLISFLGVSAILLASVPLIADDGGGDGDGGEVKFTGAIQKLPQGGLLGTWQVSGSMVQVSASTEIDQEHGVVAVGACVEVEGSLLANNSINATRIKTEEADKCGTGINPPPANQADVFGSVQKLPAKGLVGDWMVSGQTVHVAASTQIDQEKGPVTVGSCVEVKGTTNMDGSIAASEIEVRSASGGCLVPANRQAELEIFGVVQKLPTSGLIGNWMVSGRTVLVSAATEVKSGGPIVGVGACVKVQGTLASDGSVVAREIQVESNSTPCQMGLENPDKVRFTGTVQKMPQGGTTGDWTVGNRTVHVTANTEIETEEDETLTTGSCVKVRGQLESDSSILADELEALDPSDCATLGAAQGTFELEGMVESIPAGGGAGNWKIAGQTVQVTATTVLDTEHGALVVGACVEVLGDVQSAGVMVATKIESRSSSGVCVMQEGVVSAASLSGLSVAPGEVVSLFGFNLGAASPEHLEIEPDGKVANMLSNVRVLFDGVAAPLLFVSATQINVVVPFSVAGKSTTQVQIENNGAWSDSMAVRVAAATPSIFTLTQSGKGQGAVLDFDAERGKYSVNGASNAAARGSVIVMFATGGGQTDPPGSDGQVTGASGLPRPLLPVSVTIGGEDAEVQFAGAAPGIIAGVLQINVRVPSQAPQGAAVPVTLNVGGHRSPDGVTIAIR